MVAKLCSSHCAIAMAVSVHNFCLAIANVLPLPTPWLFLHGPCWLIVALNIFNWQHHWVCSKSCRYAPSLCHGTIAITLLAGPVAAGWLLFSKKNHSMVEWQEVPECCHHCAVTMMLSSLCHWPGTLLACLLLVLLLLVDCWVFSLHIWKVSLAARQELLQWSCHCTKLLQLPCLHWLFDALAAWLNPPHNP